MEQKKKKLTGQQGELMRALDISVDDLMANDEGTISDDQRKSVIQRQAYVFAVYKRLVVICSASSLIFTIIIILIVDFKAATSLPTLIVSLFFLTLAALFGGAGVYQHRLLKNDLASNSFQTIQGIAVVNIGESDSYLEINGMKLNASPDVLRRVRHLDPYIVHYLENSKVILSMEHIDEEDNIRQDVGHSRLEDKQTSDSSLSDYQESAEWRGQSK